MEARGHREGKKRRWRIFGQQTRTTETYIQILKDREGVNLSRQVRIGGGRPCVYEVKEKARKHSENCKPVCFRDSGTKKKTGGRAGDGRKRPWPLFESEADG